MISVNIAIELLGGVISVVLFISLLVSGDMKTREGGIFGCILGMQMLILLSDAFSWALVGNAAPWARGVVVAINLIIFTAGIAVQALFMEYLMGCVYRQGRRASYIPVWFNLVLCLAMETLVIVSQFTGGVYWIGEVNQFHVGPWYGMFATLMAGAYLTIGVTALCHYRALKRRDTSVFVAFTAMMMAANQAEAFYSDIMISYVMSVVATLMVFVNIQVKKTERLQLDMVEMRVAAMLSQIQPHFLYNALVAIERLCVKDPKQAQSAVASFSAYLRGNLDSLAYHEPISFEKELEHVRVYLSLEERRFGSRLRVEYDIAVQGFFLPALTLQTIVENAVQHGVSQRVEGGTVRIRTRDGGDCWLVIVEDDGVGFAPEAQMDDGRTHVGLENTRSRLAAMSGGHLEIESELDRGTTVRLLIPKEGRT